MSANKRKLNRKNKKHLKKNKNTWLNNKIQHFEIEISNIEVSDAISNKTLVKENNNEIAGYIRNNLLSFILYLNIEVLRLRQKLICIDDVDTNDQRRIIYYYLECYVKHLINKFLNPAGTLTCANEKLKQRDEIEHKEVLYLTGRVKDEGISIDSKQSNLNDIKEENIEIKIQ